MTRLRNAGPVRLLVALPAPLEPKSANERARRRGRHDEHGSRLNTLLCITRSCLVESLLIPANGRHLEPPHPTHPARFPSRRQRRDSEVSVDDPFRHARGPTWEGSQTHDNARCAAQRAPACRASLFLGSRYLVFRDSTPPISRLPTNRIARRSTRMISCDRALYLSRRCQP